MLSQTRLVTRKLALTSMPEIEVVRRYFGMLPDGYREYMTTLGCGTFCNLLHVCGPAELEDATTQFREFIEEWRGEIPGANPKLKDAKCVATMTDGGYVAWTDELQTLAVPADLSGIYLQEQGLRSPMAWKSLDSGAAATVVPNFKFPFFESSVDRLQTWLAVDARHREIVDFLRGKWPMLQAADADDSTLLVGAVAGAVNFSHVDGESIRTVRITYDSSKSSEIADISRELALETSVSLDPSHAVFGDPRVRL